MSITISQLCDVCGTTRDITNEVQTGTVQGIRQAADLAGWRELESNTHICRECITSVVPDKPNPPVSIPPASSEKGNRNNA